MSFGILMYFGRSSGTCDPMKVQLVKSYCLPLLVYCIGALRLKRSTVQHFCLLERYAFRKIFHYKHFESVKMLQIQFGTMDFSHLYDFCRWNFWRSVLKKCYFGCHFLTMLDLKLHSCVDLAHVYGLVLTVLVSDFVVSHCVQLCSL